MKKSIVMIDFYFERYKFTLSTERISNVIVYSQSLLAAPAVR